MGEIRIKRLRAMLSLAAFRVGSLANRYRAKCERCEAADRFRERMK